MLAVDELVDEHRLIERMVKLVDAKSKLAVDVDFLVVAVDFFRTFADKYHHGKEEGILFNALSHKWLSTENKKVMNELILEHAIARKTVNSLEASKEDHLKGNPKAIEEIKKSLFTLTQLYPAHIAKEDKIFFPAATKYFSKQEQEEMLNQFEEFTRDFTKRRYEQIIKAREDKS